MQLGNKLLADKQCVGIANYVQPERMLQKILHTF